MKLENRIPPPILMLAVAAVMWVATWATAAGSSPSQMPTPLRWGLAAIFFAGAGLFGFPAFSAFRKAKTTINPVQIDQASALVSSGIYRVTRNPMYVAMTLLLCAWAVWLARPLALLGPLAFVLFINRYQIVPEERAMQAKFGPAYAAYRQRTRRWL
jgi:protein-S-isoprenylcysteine O-methyltransferase Ste14